MTLSAVLWDVSRYFPGSHISHLHGRLLPAQIWEEFILFWSLTSCAEWTLGILFSSGVQVRRTRLRNLPVCWRAAVPKATLEKRPNEGCWLQPSINRFCTRKAESHNLLLLTSHKHFQMFLYVSLLFQSSGLKLIYWSDPSFFLISPPAWRVCAPSDWRSR